MAILRGFAATIVILFGFIFLKWVLDIVFVNTGGFFVVRRFAWVAVVSFAFLAGLMILPALALGRRVIRRLPARGVATGLVFMLALFAVAGWTVEGYGPLDRWRHALGDILAAILTVGALWGRNYDQSPNQRPIP